MIEIGKIQKLKVDEINSGGAVLKKNIENVFLPKSQMTKDVKEDEEINAFVYIDSDDRLTATTKEPLAQIGEIAKLKVIDTTSFGAFVDIGIDKDVLLPFKEQKYKVEKGKSYLFAIYLDKGNKLCATTDILDYLSDNPPYSEGDWINGTVYSISDGLGIFIAIDNKYKGFIPENKYFKKVEFGENIEARIVNIREDGKVDLSTKKMAYKQMDIDAEKILDDMKKNEGILLLHDKSDPKDIQRRFKMSKSAFKRAIGKLLKARIIKKIDGGFKLK
ncbi:MAG: RNA-binding protein [Firmicutes bacterium]|nr:RNA-binding protein [Bacillota bacterium]